MADPLKNVPVVGMRKRFPRVFGRYILEKSLSRGGMGEVMLAVARHVNERCVIKTIRTDLTGDEEFVGRFADEAKIMVRIEHPNIIRVFDAGKVEHDYYIAMQYVHGRDLGDVLDRAYERGEPMPEGLGLYVTDQLLRGLEYVHNLKDERGRHMGLVHRDISPQNVLIGFDGGVKLIDFGLARTDVLPARTQGALAVGKYGYMSPEQARHEDIDGRADLYSAGVMLFEVFTGDRLVDEQDQATLWQRVLNPKHRSPKTVVPTLPDIIERLIMQAVEVNPNARFDSAQQMRSFASRLSRPDATREAMVRYLRYLYPKVDFTPPVIPKFGHLSGGTEQSIIIATSDKGALSVFGRGDLPIEWTMQLDSKAIRVAVEESRRKTASHRQDEPITDANMSANAILTPSEPPADPTLLRATMRDFKHDEHQITAESLDPIDDQTQVAQRPSATSKTTRYVIDQRQDQRIKSADVETPRIKASIDAPRARAPYRDDEMTVMMNAPPQARALFQGDTPTQLSNLREELPKPMVQPVPTAIAPQAPSRRMRAIKEKNISHDRSHERSTDRPTRNERQENRPRRKKAIEVHRRTVPVEATAAVPETRSVPNYQPELSSSAPEPFPWVMWLIIMLGLGFLIVALVVFVVAL